MRKLDKLRPFLKNRVEMTVALHRHPGIAGVMEAAEQLLRAVPGIKIVKLDVPAVGLQSVNLATLPKFKAELQLKELEAARAAGVDALVAVYHSDHRELCAHERDWPFKIMNILEVIGESMGFSQEDHYKNLKIKQDVDAIITDAADLMKRHGVDLDTARKVIVNGMLSDQPLPLQGRQEAVGFNAHVNADLSLLGGEGRERRGLGDPGPSHDLLSRVRVDARAKRLRIRESRSASRATAASISFISASEIVSPSAFAFSRAFNRRMPGSRAPGCASIDAASSAEARRRAAAERRRIERDDQLPGAGRRALRRRDRTTPRRRSSSRSVRPPAAPPSAPARCPWRRPSAPSCRAAPRPDRWSACRRRRAPSLPGMFSPRCFAVMMLPRATFDSDRSITSGARPGSGQANATGLVPNTGFRSAPRRHRARRVDEHQRDQALVRQPLDRMAGRAAMARTADRRRGDALAARGVGQRGFGKLDRRKGEAVGGVDRDQAGPRPRDERASPCRRSCAPCACAAYIGTRDRPWPLSPSASAATSARATLRALSMSVRQRVRCAPPALPPEPASASAWLTQRASRAPIKLRHHELAVAERLRRGEPAVGGAHDHVDQRVAGLSRSSSRGAGCRRRRRRCARPWCACVFGLPRDLDHRHDRIADHVALAGREGVHHIAAPPPSGSRIRPRPTTCPCNRGPGPWRGASAGSSTSM